MAFKIVGSTSGNVVEVDANNNLNVVTPTTASQAGFVTLAGEMGAATDPAGRVVFPLRTSRTGRLVVGVDQLMFSLTFEGTVIPQGHIQQNLTTMTATQTGGMLVLNNGNNTVSGSAANIRTYRTFPVNQGNFPTVCRMEIRHINQASTGVVSEFGFGLATSTTAPTDGVFFRSNAAGVLKGVVCYNSTETATASLTYPTDNVSNQYTVIVHNEAVFFYINEQLVGTLSIPNTQANATSASNLPMFARVYNSGTAAPARRIEIGQLICSSGDNATNKPWSHVMAGMGSNAVQVQPGTASGQTANYANSVAPVSATLSNIAASYATLGGQFQFAALATNETDWVLFGYQNPAGTATLPGKTLYITGVTISMVNTGAANAATATTFFWALGVGATAASLATADGAATVASRRFPLGVQSLTSSAAIGFTPPDIIRSFQTPFAVPAGCFVNIILKQLNGAATASQVIRGMVAVEGYFE